MTDGKSDPPMAGNPASDETVLTEITIQPDGRVYVFGTSRQSLEVLEALNPRDPKLQRLLSQVRLAESSGEGS